MKRIVIILVLNLLIFNVVKSDEREKELTNLFNQLKNNNSLNVLNIEKKIWKIWTTHPSKNRIGFRLTKMLAQGDRLLVEKDFNGALKVFSLIISLDSNWAEAWNKRATTFYLIGEYENSIEDIKKVLQLESRHFGALSGLGLNQIELKNYEIALKSYQKVQQIYPEMKAAEVMIPMLKELIKGQNI